MASETVLLYNCGGPEWSRLRQILLMLRLRMRPVDPAQYGLPLSALLEHREDQAPVEEPFLQPMLVFCGLSDGKLEQLLTAMRRAALPPIPLKAILTTTNRDWTSQQLWQELRREHEAMTRQRGGKK